MIRSTANEARTLTRRGALGILGVGAACSYLALAGCGEQPSEPAADGQRAPEASATQDPSKLVMAISVDPDGLDPQRTAAAATFEITNNVYDPLVRADENGELVPCLAESWDVSDDGLSVTFHLREGVVFSNGNPCDAAAVVASLERLAADESPRCSEYQGLAFEAPDETTVVVTGEVLDVALPTKFASAWSGVVDVSEAQNLASGSAGTGPYLVQSWTPQQSVVLAANPSYWGEAPATEVVELRLLPDAASQVSALRAGEVDVIWAQQPSQLDPFQGNDDFQVLEFPMNGVQLMAMNCANEALADPRVRQAINLAVDKDALIDAVWWGYGQKIGSHFPPVAQGFVDTADTYGYDPDAAVALLEEAGYGDGLTLRMRLPESYPSYVDAGQVIADSLKKVGITCDIEIVDWSTWLSEVYNGRDYDLTVVGHTGRVDPIVLLARYGSTSSENYFNYANDEVDALIASYRTELDETKRADYVAQIQRILAEDVPALYIQTPVMVYVAGKDVRDFRLLPLDLYDFSQARVEG